MTTSMPIRTAWPMLEAVIPDILTVTISCCIAKMTASFQAALAPLESQARLTKLIRIS
jgi:hypothetical protein